MAFAPQFLGHRFGAPTALHTIEGYLDYVCPFSARMFNRLSMEVFPHIEQTCPEKFQFIFRQQIQSWHPTSGIVHEAALAVERINPKKFYAFSAKLFEAQKEYFDEYAFNKTRRQLNESLAKLAASVGVPENEFLKLVDIQSVESAEDATNAGNKITADLKLQIKLGRQNGIHVSPTILLDGLVDNEVSSGWTLDQWKEWLSKKA